MSSPYLPGTPDDNTYASYTLDHHGLVAGMVDELGLVERIDAMIPQDLDQRHLSVGVAVKAMIIIGLGFVQRALYLTPDFFRGKPVGRLLGAGITAEMLNDDALGRALDAIYAFGVEAFYFLLASGVVQQLGLSGEGGHLDSTSFHVDGEYNSGDEAAAEGVVHIRQGYSRDHRPDLNQVVLQLVVENQAGIPLLMAASGGNVNDQAGFHGLVHRHKGQLAGGGLQYLVADSALYTAKSLRELDGTVWVSRVPETFGAAREVMQAVAGDLADGGGEMAWRTLCVTEAGVRQRWLVVHSRAARRRAEATLRKRHLRQGKADLKAFDRLRRQRFGCEGDARDALEAFAKTLKLTEVHEGRIVRQTTPPKKRRQAEGQAPYAVEGQLASLIDVHTRQLLQKSCFIVATNDTEGAVLGDEQALEAYRKDQQKVERGFRFLKDPLFMASTLFLKSPRRILRRQRFGCEGDARDALEAFAKTLKLTEVHEGRIVRQTTPPKKRRQAEGQAPYAVEGQLASLIDVHTRQLLQKSCFIVATNDTEGAVLGDEQALEAYRKDQQKVERGFRFLKDPLFMASTLFLKSPRRIMALMAIMTLCLMVYAALEHRIRQGLAQQSQTFPDQKGKPTERPTARWVFQSFMDIHILTLPTLAEIVLNLKAHHRVLLNLLGERYVAIYANSE